jgi:threonylcarbamoyladenosine tRNA methylthiotransferase MtaB
MYTIQYSALRGKLQPSIWREITPLNVTFFTLGCKVNQVEAGKLERLFSERGHTVAAPSAGIDAAIVGTCSVTGVSDGKSRRLIRRAAKLCPGAMVAVWGCFGQSEPEVCAGLPGVALTAGPNPGAEFVEAVEKICRGGNLPPADQPRRAAPRRITPSKEGNQPRTRALLKIQDGCDNRCTYCVIPSLRGPSRSVPLDEIIAEASSMAGAQEIVVTGIEISSYQPGLPALIRALREARPGARLRLGSLEPRIVGAAFLDAAPLVCPHFHLSLQSGCDATLSRMGRLYTTQQYRAAAASLRSKIPGCSLTTDLIVGFPGECEEEFAETLDFLRETRFAAVHVFPYSPRKSTPAAAMPGQVPPDTKKRRVKAAMAVAAECADACRREQIGRTLGVLFEEPGAGHSDGYFWVKAPGGAPNTLAEVRILGVEGEALVGEIR